jgi:uncharacterized protein (DUF885 family)
VSASDPGEGDERGAGGQPGALCARGVADEFVRAYSARNPLLALDTSPGQCDGTLADYGPDGVTEFDDIVRRSLAELRSVTPDGDPDPRLNRLLRERLTILADRHEAGLAWSDLNAFHSPLHEPALLLERMPLGTPELWSCFLRRMSLVPAALDGLARRYRVGASRGQVPARHQVLLCADMCERWGCPDGADGRLRALALRRLRSASAPGTTSRDRIVDAADRADQAYAAFAGFLRSELAPVANPTEAVGRDHLQLDMRLHTGADLNLDDAYDWGWHELGLVSAARDSAALQIDGAGRVDEAMAILDSDPAYIADGPEGYRRRLEGIAASGLEKAAAVFDIAPQLRSFRIELLRPDGPPGGYYPPSEGFQVGGKVIWRSLPASLSIWRDPVFVFHELIPGHHLQIGYTVLHSERFSAFQRFAARIPGHHEGWGLYAEKLMDELGAFQDPGSRLGMLDARLLRTVRLVIDIGLHAELPIPDNVWGWRVGGRWTRPAVEELLAARTSLPPANRKTEADRYCGWPGQASSYLLGERAWCRGRETALRRRADSFDLKAFHMAGLDLGPIGLDQLTGELAAL